MASSLPPSNLQAVPAASTGTNTGGGADTGSGSDVIPAGSPSSPSSSAADRTTAQPLCISFSDRLLSTLAPPPSTAADLLPLLHLSASTSIRYVIVDCRTLEAPGASDEDRDIDEALARAAAATRTAAGAGTASASLTGVGASGVAVPAGHPAVRNASASATHWHHRPAPYPYALADVVCEYERSFPWQTAAPSATVSVHLLPYVTATSTSNGGIGPGTSIATTTSSATSAVASREA